MSFCLRSLLLRSRCQTSRFSYSADIKPPVKVITPVVSKSKKAGLIKNLHRENKEMFGELLETKREKVSRVKKVTGVVAANDPDDPSGPPETVFVAVRQRSSGPKGMRKNSEQTSHVPLSSLEMDAGISKHGDSGGEKKATRANESDWMIKSFSKRTKVLSRVAPEEWIAKSGQHLQPLLFSSPTAVPPTPDSPKAEMSPRELREIPTHQQFLTSVAQCQDINHYGEVKQIRKEDRQSGGDINQDEEELKQIRKEGIQNSADNGTMVNIPPGEIISYPYPRFGENDGIPKPKVPSVTRILTATMSPQQLKILKLWEEKMIRELGEDGFKEYKEALFRNGKILHGNVQSFLSGKSINDLEIPPPIEGHWRSLQSVLKTIHKVHVLESYVSHPELNYGGIVDCVAVFRDKLVLIDWKTSEKPKPFISNTYDTPLQIAAYIDALNNDPSYKFKVMEGLAVIAYKDGKDCQIFHLNSSDILKYSKIWLQRLKLYQTREIEN